MKKYTLKENLVSFLIGAILSLPICIGAYVDQQKPKSVPYVIAEEEPVVIEVEATTEENLQVVQNEKVSLGTFAITAYCSCERCCPGTSDGLTYTETVATEGRTIAVDPNVIPLGSIVEINGVSYVAEDIGGAIKNNRIDIFFNSHNDAREFGRQYLDVFIIGG